MSLADVRIGQVGQIISGDQVGRFVKVLDDSENTGGFLILTSIEPTFKNGHGDDNWVEDRDTLSLYFHEADWLIEWL